MFLTGRTRRWKCVTVIEKFSFDLHIPGSRILQQFRPAEGPAFSALKEVRKKMILVKDDLELRTHTVMKLVAYILFYDPRLMIEFSVDMHYKPDLVIPGDHGVPELWIDCGQIAVKKVESLAAKLRTTRICLVKETKRELDSFRRVIEKKVEHPERVRYLAFEKGFVSGIAESLARTNQVTVYEVMDNVLGVALNDEVFESTLYR